MCENSNKKTFPQQQPSQTGKILETLETLETKSVKALIINVFSVSKNVSKNFYIWKHFIYFKS